MTTPMLEKCARAVFYASHHPDDVSSGLADEMWDEWGEREQRPAYAKARAVLTALLEPDEGCLEAMAEWVNFDSRVKPEAELAEMRSALARLVQHILKGEGNV